MTLSLSLSDRQQIAEAAQAAFPQECCGLLIGTDGRVNRVVAARNLRAEPDRFELDPALHLKIQRELRGTAERVIGHYHSHPNGHALPSQVDLAEAYDPGLVWVIAATDGQAVEIAAFEFDGTEFKALALTP
ncbi:M67 family metallopeptidase [Govanella unica]|uniref:M67 family metallopeptidase n=1 Tax=Govanella unica TaxID=2975056 RepID=A0A9X3Z6D0_9PROT|nr:M67 family metallopeptidase [Govania unica]MDA5193006.1 M67 family metallopeptidase [Govania unica]